MALRKQHPVRFAPKGLNDAYDSTDAFPGACRSLQNLIFDEGNPELVVCRPGVVMLTDFVGFNTPTFVTVHISIGDMEYGMVSTALTPGYDEPFAYNVATDTFIAIAGVVAGNVPASPPLTGPWVPPSMAVVGTKILVAHSGFSGAGTNFIGVIDIAVPAAPVWSSANLATNVLPSVPTVVANFNNRAYYACGNIAYFSDVLVPLTRTNASQSLTVGNPTPIIAMVGLPIQTTSSGIVQALTIFKEIQIWQVTGDLVTTNLLLNWVSLTTGTVAPRTVVQTSFGIVFMATNGPYVVDAVGQIRLLSFSTDTTQHDLQNPFIYCTIPSRASAGYNTGIYRICVDAYLNGFEMRAEYWFDTDRRRWNGPHTWPVDCSSAVGNYFVVSHARNGAMLCRSQVIQDFSSVYSDHGTPLYFSVESSTLPKDATMTEKQVVESTVELSTAGQQVTYKVEALTEKLVVMNTVYIVVNSLAYLWGAFFWGVGYWSSTINIPSVYTVPWTGPLVFQKMAIRISGQSSSNITIGSFFARYQDTGYTNMQTP